jgi:hypothetical protein
MRACRLSALTLALRRGRIDGVVIVVVGSSMVRAVSSRKTLSMAASMSGAGPVTDSLLTDASGDTRWGAA